MVHTVSVCAVHVDVEMRCVDLGCVQVVWECILANVHVYLYVYVCVCFSVCVPMSCVYMWCV